MSMSWEEMKLVKIPLFFELPSPFYQRILSADVYLSDDGPQTSDYIFFGNALKKATYLNEPISEEEY